MKSIDRFYGAFGAGFSHAFSTTLMKRPKYFTWLHNRLCNTTFWFDHHIRDGIYVDEMRCPNKFAWLLESNSVIPNAVDFVINNVELVSNSYRILLTHNKDIADLAPNFKYIFPHGHWLNEAKVYPKSKLVSMISSNKNWTQGHQERLQLVNKFRNSVDLYGRGFNEFEKHEDALCDYYFSIAVENEKRRGYVSEKLFSCFASATLPIYYGDPSIGDHFNTEGIITLTDDFDIASLTPELYRAKFDAVLDNLERVKAYNNIEDVLWEKYLKQLI